MDYVGMCNLKGYVFLAIIWSEIWSQLVYDYCTHLELGVFVELSLLKVALNSFQHLYFDGSS